MTNNINIPHHWQLKKLEDLLTFYIGGDWGKDEHFIDENFDFAFCIRGSEIKDWNKNKGNTASLRKIKKTNIEKRKLQEGDILVEISGGGPEQPVGRTVLIDKAVLSYKPEIPKICTNFLRLIRPSNEANPFFLNLFLTLFYNSSEIGKYQAGSNNLRNLKFPDYLRIEIPLPPLPEQQAIVAKIEELLSELENGKQQLLTAQQQLKVYRQSLLKAAFEGKLTNKNVKDGELPKGWKWALIGDICDMKAGFFVKADNIEKECKDGLFPCYGGNGLRGYTNSFTHKGKYSLVGRQGALCGNVHRVNGVFHATEHAVVTSPKVGLNTDWMFYKLTAMKLNQYSAGAAQPGLSVNKLLKIEVCYPPLAEQQLIVDELESKLTVCDKIEETISQSLHQAETLKQSILKKAFEGQLVKV